MAHVLLTAFIYTGPGLLALDLGVDDLRRAGIFVICMILAIGVHEFSHAFTAHKLGDPTPESQGRLTLNPIAHMDPVGTLLLPLVLALAVPGMLFGWGRPVETVARYYTRKVSMRSGMALVAFAGPLSNLLLAVLTLGIIAVLNATGVIDPASLLRGSGHALEHPLLVFFYLNILLFAFNLLPLHPLDGGKVLAWLLGPKYQHVDDFLARYGFIILIVLVFALPQVLGYLFWPFFELGKWALAMVLV
ncbi:MAG: site-2 protease family protein [Myxococcales bacterium]|nr:site-2 protease family protein [Myxococcales bacterium]